MIKWNEYTPYSRAASVVFLLGVVPALTFYIGTQYEKTLVSLDESARIESSFSASDVRAAPDTSLASDALPEVDDPNDPVFTATFGKTYAAAKKSLTAEGWMADVSTTTMADFPSAGDRQFPEIGGCGSGTDAVCFVNFRKKDGKGDVSAHLDVRIGGGHGLNDSNTEWTVVGND